MSGPYPKGSPQQEVHDLRTALAAANERAEKLKDERDELWGANHVNANALKVWKDRAAKLEAERDEARAKLDEADKWWADALEAERQARERAEAVYAEYRKLEKPELEARQRRIEELEAANAAMRAALERFHNKVYADPEAHEAARAALSPDSSSNAGADLLKFARTARATLAWWLEDELKEITDDSTSDPERVRRRVVAGWGKGSPLGNLRDALALAPPWLESAPSPTLEVSPEEAP